jgi:hypothetical protein
MKTLSPFAFAIFASGLLCLLPTKCPGQDTNAAPEAATAPSSSPLVVAHNVLPVYHPPDIGGGILPIRVGGGSRGGGNDGITVGVLVPDQIALTTHDQPSLYWYQSKLARTRCEVTLTEPEKARPLLDLQSTGPTAAGIHSVKLSDFKVKLMPRVVYKWSIAVVVDPASRSQDIIANGIIEYREPTSDLAAKLAAANDSNRAAIYAAAGIWYDAFDCLSTAIEKNPQDQTLPSQRAALMTQVGLNGAAIEAIAAKK